MTRTYARNKVFYQGRELVVFDGPGCKSKRDTYNHSYVMRHGLTHEPLNGVFIFVEYNARIGSNMAENFWEVAKMLKLEYFPLVVLVVTKMDTFKPQGSFQSKEDIQEHIRSIFANEHDVQSVVFSELEITKQDIFSSLYHAVADKPAVKLEYSEREFLRYFELKAWEGRAMQVLYRTKNTIQEIKSGFLEGLSALENTRDDFSADEFQDFVFSAIQQSSLELENNVIDPFLKRNGDSQIEFDDYTAWIELKKLVDFSQADVRNEAKRLLNINPDDTSNFRNAIRRCQYCGEVWVKVEGCDGETTCGLIPSDGGDAWGGDSFCQNVWSKVEGGLWRPRKFTKKKKARVARTPMVDSDRKVGCGRTIDWKNQAIVPEAELDILFSTQELEQILASLSSKPDFVSKKEEREENIPVFASLDRNGNDVVERF